MKTILFVDRNSVLSSSVRSLAEILEVPFELVARKNEIRRLVATGNVGIMFANSEITTVRFDDMITEIDVIQKRNKLAEFPTYYICNDTPQDGENIPANVPSAFLIKRSKSLEQVYTIIDETILSDKKVVESGGFIHYSLEHKAFIENYEKVLNELSAIAERTLKS